MAPGRDAPRTARLCRRRRRALAGAHRWAVPRRPRRDPGRARRGSPGRPHRAVRPRPDEADPRLLQGQPAEGRPHRGPRRRRRPARARRADLRAGPAHGTGLPGGRPRAAQRRLHGPAVESHPRRGRSTGRSGDDHPPGPDRDHRNPRRPATPYPHPRPRGHGRRARRASPTRRASRTTSPSGSTATSTAGSRSTPSTSTPSWAGCTPRGSTPSRSPRRAWTRSSCAPMAGTPAPLDASELGEPLEAAR